MKKRMLSLLLVLALLIGMSGAYAAVGQFNLGDDSGEGNSEFSFAETAVFHKDTAYLVLHRMGSNNGPQLYAWKGGDEAPQPLEVYMDRVYPAGPSDTDEEAMENMSAEPVMETGEGEGQVPVIKEEEPLPEGIKVEKIPDYPRVSYSFLISDGERLLVFNANTGELSEMLIQGTTVTTNPVATLKMPEEEKMLEYPTYRPQAVVDGKLVFSSEKYDRQGNQRKNPLILGDMTTGETKYIPVDYAINAVAYKDNSVLVLSQNTEEAYREATDKVAPPDYVIYNLSTGAQTAPAPLPEGNYDGAMAYLPEADALVFLNRGKIMELTDNLTNVKQVGYTTVENSHDMGILSDGTVGLNGFSRVVITAISQDFNPEAYLMVYGGYMDQGTIAFSRKYPDVPVYSNEDYYQSIQDMAAALMAGEPIDVLRMNLAYSPFEQMKRKGYCADLSGDAEIAAFIDQLHPFVKQHCMKDGQIVAIPFSVYLNGDSFYTSQMKEVGLTEADLPNNLVELCQFVTRWNDEFAADFPNIIPVDAYQDTFKQGILGLIMDRYVLYQEFLGQPLTFDTPVFRELMAAWSEMRTDELDKLLKRVGEEEYYPDTLMVTYDGGFDNDFGYSIKKQLSLTANTPPLYEMDGSFAFINPKTTKMNYAMELLKSYMNNMDKMAQYYLLSTINEPLLNPYFEESLKGAQNWVAIAEKNLADASDDDKRMREEELAQAKKELENAERRKYTISAEALENYKTNVVPNVVLRKESPWDFSSDKNSEEIRSIINRLTVGDMSVDQFITEMDGKLRMIQLENQ